MKNEVVDKHQSDKIIGSVVDDDHVVGQGVMVCPNASFSPGSMVTLYGDNSCEGMHIKNKATLADVHVSTVIVEDDSSLSGVNGDVSIIASGATIKDFEAEGPLSLHIGSQSILEGNSVASPQGKDIIRSGLFIGDEMSVKDNDFTMYPGGIVSIHCHEGLGRIKDYDRAEFHNNIIEVSELSEFKANGSPSVKNCTIFIGEGSLLEVEGVSMDGVNCIIPPDVQLRIRNWDKGFDGHITSIECVGDTAIINTSGGTYYIDIDVIR